MIADNFIYSWYPYGCYLQIVKGFIDHQWNINAVGKETKFYSTEYDQNNLYKYILATSSQMKRCLWLMDGVKG